MKAMIVLGVVGATLLVGTMTRMSRPAVETEGMMPEVIVAAEAPSGLLDEVVVRPAAHPGTSEAGDFDSAGLGRLSDEVPN